MVDLTVEFALKFFEVYHISLLSRLDTLQGCKFVIRLRSQLCLNVLDERVQLFDSILFGFLNLFN